MHGVQSAPWHDAWNAGGEPLPGQGVPYIPWFSVSMLQDCPEAIGAHSGRGREVARRQPFVDLDYVPGVVAVG